VSALRGLRSWHEAVLDEWVMDTEPDASAVTESVRDPAVDDPRRAPVEVNREQPAEAGAAAVSLAETDVTAAPVAEDGAAEAPLALIEANREPSVLTETEPAPRVEQTEDVPPVEVNDVGLAAAAAAAALGRAAEVPAKADAPTNPALPAGTDPPARQRAAGPTVVTKPRPEPRRKRRWVRGVAVFFGVLIGVAIVVVLIAPGYLRGRVVDEARARGILLSFGAADFDFSRIDLRDVKVSLAGVSDFEASATVIEVDIEEWEPRAIRAGGLTMALSGTDVISALGAWKTAHPTALVAPVRGVDAHVEWRLVKGTEATLVLDRARVAIDPEKGSIDAISARVAGRDAGPVKVAWTMPAEGFVVEIQPLSPPLSAIHAEVRSAKEGARIKLVLERTPLAPLQAALGLPKGAEGIVADGEVEMPLPSLEHPAPIDGTLQMTVKGFVPPHPRDLDGILFGDTTAVRSKFLLAADLSSARLTGVTVEAGALALTGTGDVVREGFDARVSMKLKGSIPCTMLATSAAVARLGRDWGGLAGGLLGGALKGNVGVHLSIEAKASDIKSAKIVHSASIGCKVAIPGLPEIVIR